MLGLRALSVCLVLVLGLTAAACGGGGGGGAPAADASLLSGDYFVCFFSGEDGVTDTGFAGWGVATADGAGGLAGSIMQNQATVVSVSLPLPGAYTVAADRETTLTLPGPSGYAGWTNSAGTLALSGRISAGQPPASLALVKLGSGFSDASLSGDYHFAALSINASGDAVSVWGTATFDGAGNISFSTTSNNEGTVSTPPPSVLPGTYAVAADGQVTMSFPGGDLEGCLTPDGQLLLGAGGVVNGQEPFLFLFTPKSGSASNATLSGTYQLVGIERESGGFTSLTGSAEANGSGSITASFTRNSDGFISISGPDVVPYSVAADGTLTVDGALTGGVAPGGAYGLIAGPTTGTDGPRMFVLMRR